MSRSEEISLARFIEFLETLTSSCTTAISSIDRKEYEGDRELIGGIRAAAQLLIDQSRNGGAVATTFPLGVNC